MPDRFPRDERLQMKLALLSLLWLLATPATFPTTSAVVDDAPCGQTSTAWLPSYLVAAGEDCNSAQILALTSGVPNCEWCTLYERCPRTILSWHISTGSVGRCSELAMPPPKVQMEMYLCGGDYCTFVCSGC